MPFAAKLTIVVIVAVTALLIGYDIWAATNNVANSIDTISGRMRIWAFETPVIPWVWCGLAGHFFGPWHYAQFMPAKMSMGLLICLSWAVIWFGIFMRSKGVVIPPWTICVPAFLTGAMLWGQT